MTEQKDRTIAMVGASLVLFALLIGFSLNSLVKNHEVQIDELGSKLEAQIEDVRRDLTGQIEEAKTEIRHMRAQLQDVEIDVGKAEQTGC